MELCLILSDQGTNSANYNSLMNTLFDPTDGADAAGLNVIRVPIGASDYSTMGLCALHSGCKLRALIMY